MSEEFAKIISDRMSKLPPKVAFAIKTVPWVDQVRSIAKNNNLDSDKTNLLEIEATITVLGLESPKNLPRNILRELQIKEDAALKISEEIGTKVLDVIKKEIEKTAITKKSSSPSGFEKIVSSFDRKALSGSDMAQKQLNLLPVPLQRAIAITPWRKLVAEVAQSNNLDADKTEKLTMEAMLVMYGFEAEADLAGNIARELAVDQPMAKKLEDEVEMRVFSVVLSKANDLANEPEETLQSVPKVINNELPVTVSKPSINLIKPVPVESPINLAPVARPSGIIAEKLSQVSTSVSRPTTYPGGIDPYREPTN